MFEEEIALLAYPLEAVFAEKLHALVSHGKANSRMKDYHDMLVMARNGAVEKRALKKAIQTTFGQRQRIFTPPIEFPDDEIRQLQKTWNLYRAKQRDENLPSSIEDVLDAINGRRVIALNRGQAMEDPLALVWYPRPQKPDYFTDLVRAIK